MKHTKTLSHHVWIAIILFLLLMFLQWLLTFLPYIEDQYKDIFFAVLLIIFGVYLIFIVWFYFSETFGLWSNRKDWITGLLKAYGSLILFCLLFSILLPGWSANELFDLYTQFGGFTRAFALTSIQYFMLGLSLAFPVSLFSAFLAIKSLFIAHRKYQTRIYGIALLLFSGILLLKSYPSCTAVLRMLFANG